MRRIRMRIASCLLTLALVSAFALSCAPNQELILADSSISWWMAPTIVAHEMTLNGANFYSAEGLRVKTFDMQTGLAAKNALLSGSSDLAIVASTPVASGLYSHEQIVVLCSFVESSALLAILTPEDSSSSASGFARPPSPVAMVPGTISEWYLRSYLQQHCPQLRLNDINLLNVAPPSIGLALQNHQANSGAIWEPFVTEIANTQGLRVNRDRSLYTLRIYLVTRPDVLSRRRPDLVAFVKALQHASAYISKNEGSVKNHLIGKYVDQRASMDSLWADVDFSVKFDYDEMSRLIKKDALLLRDVNRNLPELSQADYEQLFDRSFRLDLQ